LVFPPNHVAGLRLNFEENNPVDGDAVVDVSVVSGVFLKGLVIAPNNFPKKEGVGGGTGPGVWA
jgi:hypothetical protein